jgi:hypothetical protein
VSCVFMTVGEEEVALSSPEVVRGR